MSRGRCSRHVPAKETADRNMPVPADLGHLWAREFSPKWTDRGMRGALTEKDQKNHAPRGEAVSHVLTAVHTHPQ